MQSSGTTETPIDLRQYLALAKKWLWQFVLAGVVAAVGAWLATRAMPREYSSQTTLVVGSVLREPEPDYDRIYLAETLALTYAEMAAREPVLQGVVDELGLETSWQAIRGMMQARAKPGTPLIEIRVIDNDPQRAMVIADAIAGQLVVQSPSPSGSARTENLPFVEGQIATLRSNIERAENELAELDQQMTMESSARAIADLESRSNGLQTKVDRWSDRYSRYLTYVDGGSINSLAVIEPAHPGWEVGPNVGSNVMFAAALGLGLAIMAVLALEYFDGTAGTIRTVRDAERHLGLPGLATLELVEGMGRHRDALVTAHEHGSMVAEAFRMLRTSLWFVMQGRSAEALVVTSPDPAAGKSTVAANLAVVLSQAGKKVVLVDADLRRPSIHRFFGLDNSIGATSALDDASPVALDEALTQIEGLPGLSVLTSGPLPANPSELLESPAAREMLQDLRRRADIVILDSPPLLVFADAAIMATYADVALMVLESGATRADAARAAQEVLATVGVTPIGAVINKLDPARVTGEYYSASYQYYHRYYGNSGDDAGPTFPALPIRRGA